jgi:hypothetical protein
MRSLLLATVIAASFASPAFAQETSDPFPIRRILVPSKKIAAEIEKLNQGPTVVVPYDDLQRRLAALVQPIRGEAAHLIKAEYSAELSGKSLANGRGQWTLRNPGEAGWMPLPRFSLALSKPRLDGAEAILGESAGQAGLWLDRPGSSQLTFDWSVRGLPSMLGLAFDFALPASPVSTLELRLPIDLAPSSPQTNVLVAGPFEAESPTLRTWRLQITGKANFELLLRPTAVTAGAGSMIAAVEATHAHLPGVMNAEFDWNIDILHHPVQEIAFELDSRLQPYDVSIKGPEVREWQVREEKREKGGSVKVLTLGLREPFAGTVAACKVKCWAPAVSGIMTNPGMRLRQAVGRSEKLTLSFHPDLQLESWDAGRFRLAASNAATDQSLVLTLFDSAPNGPLESRPRYELRSQEAAFAVTESNRWRVGALSHALDLDLRVDVSRGKLFQIGLKLPPGKWKGDSLRTEPPDLLRSWTTLGSTLLVDFKRGVDPKTDAKVLATLVSDNPLPSGPAELDFPDIEPIQAAIRIGSMALEIDPTWNATVLRSNVAVSPSSETEAFRFEYRQEKLEGRLKLAPRRVRPVVRLEQETTLADGKQIHRLRLDVDPVRGAVKAVDLSVSPPLPSEAVWRGADVANVERLGNEEAARVVALAAASHAWASVTTAAASPPTQIWRVHLREPLVRRATLEWEVVTTQTAGWRKQMLPWSVPIALPLHADRGDMKISVGSPDETLTAIDRWGLEPLQATNEARLSTSWRVANRTSFGPHLTLARVARPASPEHLAVIDRARLRVSTEPGGAEAHHLSFEVRGWRQPTFPLVLARNDIELVGIAIDGRWMAQPELHRDHEKVTLRIPVPATKVSWHCEVAYTAPALGRPFALTFQSNPVGAEFPTPTTGLRRQWRLPPDWVPLHQEAFTSWSRHKPGLDTLRRWWTWGTQAVLQRSPEFHPATRSLVAAEAGMRRQPGAEGTLADVLERLGTTIGPGSLVIDTAAMQSLGLSPHSPISAASWNDPQPIWTQLGLVARGIGDVVVLTTESREAAWRTNHGGDWSDLLKAGVAEAASRGQDASGELQSVDFWSLQSPRSPTPHALAFFGSDFGDHWTEWTPLPGDAQVSWIAVSAPRLRWAAWTSAAALALAAWSFRRRLSKVDQFRILWLVLVAATFFSFWVPLSLRDLAFAPIVFVFGFLAAWHVSILAATSNRKAPNAPRRSVALKSAVAVAFGAAFAAASIAQAPPPFAVLIPTNEPNSAYVSTELLRRIQELEAARSVNASGPVVLQAAYEGRRVGDRFEFDANFEVHAFSEKATWLLPLTGVDLKPGIFLDGAPVFPTPAPRGYVFMLPRKGTQRLTLSFVAKSLNSADQQELRFGVPTAWSARVLLSGADLGREVGLVRCLGEESITQDGKGNVVRLKGELGPENVVHVRWQPAIASPAAKTSIRERYLWDLRAGHQGLTGILQVTPGQPGMSKLELQLPPGLETRSLEVQTLGKSPLPLLKAWRAFEKGVNNKWIAVELNHTVAAPFRLTAQWTPTFAVAPGRLDLRIPLPANAAFAESLAAFAVESFDASDRPRNLGVTPLAPETFAKLWLESGGKETVIPSKAYSFGREVGQAAQGAIEVTLSPVPTAVQAEIAWTVHPHFADVAATATWTANDDLTLLEAVVPPEIVLIDIQSNHVHRWSRKGDRVAMWLSQPRKQAVVQLVGWRKHSGGNDAKTTLPPIRFLANQVQTQVKAAASAGLSIRLDRAVGVKIQSASAEPNRIVGFAEGSAYELAVRARREPPRLDWHVLTAADAHDERGYLVQHVRGRLSHGELLEFEIKVSTDMPLRLELGGSGTSVSMRSAVGEQRWLVRYPAGSGSLFAFSVRGEFPAATGVPVRLPSIEFSTGAVQSEVVVADGMASARPTNPGWAEAKLDGPELAPWKSALPITASKGAVCWKRTGSERLVLQAAFSPAAQNASVLGASRHWFVSEAGDWICEETFLIAMQIAKSIEAILPPDCHWLEAELDDRLVMPSQMGGNRIRIDSDTRGLRRLRILWKSEKAKRDSAPTEGVRLLSKTRYPVEERIDVPSPRRSTEPSGPLAEAWLSESRLLLEASRTLLETPGDPLLERGQLLEAQGRLRSLFAWAKARLNPSADANLSEELQHLNKQNSELLKKHLLQLDVGEAGRTAGETSCSSVGVPLIRHTMSDVPLPPATLIERPSEFRPSLWALQLAAALFCLMGLISFSPRGLKAWTALWPEQTCVLLGVAYWLWGFSLVGTVLLIFAVGLRLSILVRLSRNLLARWRPAQGAG